MTVGVDESDDELTDIDRMQSTMHMILVSVTA